MAARQFNGKLHKESEIWDKPGLQWSVLTKEMGQQKIIHWLYAIVSSNCEVAIPLLMLFTKGKAKTLLEDRTWIIIFLPLLCTASYTEKMIMLQ